MSEEMHYPNLIPCRIIVNGSGGSSKPPVRLPAACLAAAQEPELAPVYDFALEKTVLEMAEDRQRTLTTAESEEEIKQTLLVKMKSLTSADDNVCIELLESNKYDLHTSVEAYFAR